MLIKRWGGWLILGLCFGVTSWLLRRLEEPEISTVSLQQVPDYTLTTFTTRRMDESGYLKSQLTAETMKHYQNTNTELAKPQLIFYKHTEPMWRVHAETGEIAPTGKQIWLWGQTTWERPATASAAALTVISQDVSVQLVTHLIETQAPTTILSASGQTQSVGIRLDMSTEQLALLSKVRGKYVLR
jgi:lipopolysaccharide export system protein LptC